MKKYTVRTYKLNKSVSPAIVLQTLEEIMQKQSVYHQNCLFKMVVPIIEYEYEGIHHSNQKKNAILNICEKHPVFESFFEHLKVRKEDDHIDESLTLNNFRDDYSLKTNINYSVLRAVVAKIPRPYAVHSLELVFNGIHFTKEEKGDLIKPSQSGFGAPVGDYILYERCVCGSEKHAYLLFSAKSENDEAMRKLFFDFTEKVAGKYDGTETQD